MANIKGLCGVLTAMAAAAVAPTIEADSLSCNRRIVATGDSTLRVRKVCGEPDEASTRIEVRRVLDRVTVPCGDRGERCSRVVERAVEVVIDEWTYDFGRGRFLQHLTFEQSKLVGVEAGSRSEE